MNEWMDDQTNGQVENIIWPVNLAWHGIKSIIAFDHTW